MRRRQLITSVGILGAVGIGGIVAARNPNLAQVPSLQESSSTEPFELPTDSWHQAGFRRVFDYGEYTDQQLIVGLLDEDSLDAQFAVFLESGAGRVDYFINHETGEIYQDSSQSTNKDYYNEVTRIEQVRDGFYLEVETKADGTGGPKIDYPATWQEIDSVALSDLDLISIAFTDRWDKTTYQSIDPIIPEVDLEYHQEHGVEYALQDTPGWSRTGRSVSADFATADARTDTGLDIYLEVEVEQPTYDFEVREATITDGKMLELSVNVSNTTSLSDKPMWTSVDKIVKVMNQGEIAGVDIQLEGGRYGPHAFELFL